MHRCGKPVDGALAARGNTIANGSGERAEGTAMQHRGGTATLTEPVDYAAVWSAAIQDLHEVIGSAQKRAYLSLTQLRGIFDDTVILAVPDAYTRDVIESQLHTLITEALGRQFGRQIQ